MMRILFGVNWNGYSLKCSKTDEQKSERGNEIPLSRWETSPMISPLQGAGVCSPTADLHVLCARGGRKPSSSRYYNSRTEIVHGIHSPLTCSVAANAICVELPVPMMSKEGARKLGLWRAPKELEIHAMKVERARASAEGNVAKGGDAVPFASFL
jgi:hypothetical protein